MSELENYCATRDSGDLERDSLILSQLFAVGLFAIVNTSILSLIAVAIVMCTTMAL